MLNVVELSELVFPAIACVQNNSKHFQLSQHCFSHLWTEEMLNGIGWSLMAIKFPLVVFIQRHSTPSTIIDCCWIQHEKLHPCVWGLTVSEKMCKEYEYRQHNWTTFRSRQQGWRNRKRKCPYVTRVIAWRDLGVYDVLVLCSSRLRLDNNGRRQGAIEYCVPYDQYDLLSSQEVVLLCKLTAIKS